MKPYYQDNFVTIYNGDLFEVLPFLDSADLVLTDPPYNVGLGYSSHDDSMCASEYEEFSLAWFTIAESKAKKLIFSCGDKNLKFWINNTSPSKVGFWYKPGICRVEPMLFYGCKIDLIIAPIKKEVDIGTHPCPKPVLWAERCIQFSGKKNRECYRLLWGEWYYRGSV